MYIIISILAMWIIASLFLDFNSVFLPDASTFFTVLYGEILQFEIFKHLSSTVGRVLSGVILSLVIGMPVGILLSYSQKIKKQVMPLIDLLRSLPTSMLFPIFIFFIGFGEVAKISIVLYLSTPITIISIVGSQETNRHARSRGDYLELHRDRIKTSVLIESIFWDSLPSLISGIKLAISLSLVVVIVTEMFFVSSSTTASKA